MGWIEEAVERRNRELFLPKQKPEAGPIDEPLVVIGEKWIQFVCTDYATRERRTRVLISQDEISEVKQHYDSDKWGNRYWCSIFLKNGHQYQVKATYEEVVTILRKSMQPRKTTKGKD